MNVLTRHGWLAIPVLALTLSACQQADAPPKSQPASSAADSAAPQQNQSREQHQPLIAIAINRTLTQPGCKSEPCATVELHSLVFDNDDALSAELARRLLHMGAPMSESEIDGDQLPQTVDAYARELFAQSEKANEGMSAPRPYAATLEAKEVDHHDDLLILELNSYVYTGGAHGMPGTAYMVIDEKSRQIVTLDDMLKAGQKPAFEAALKTAWQRWHEKSEAGLSLDPDHWPFVPSDNAAPLSKGIAVTYNAYDLGPYAIGQPTLTIPYSDLEGILKLRFMPKN